MTEEQALLLRGILRKARIMIPLTGILLVMLQWWQNAQLMSDAQTANAAMLDIWRNHAPAFPLESLSAALYVPTAVSPLGAFDAGDGPWLAQSIWMQLTRVARAQDQLGYDLFPAGRQMGLTAAIFAQYLIPCLALFLAWRQVSLGRARNLQSWLLLQSELIELAGPMVALCCLLTALLQRQSLGIEGALRLILALGAYVVYCLACGSLCWLVYQSWRSIPRSTAALVFFWLFNFTLARPFTINVASAVYALPSLDTYARRIEEEVRNGYNGVEPRPDRERRFAAEILREYNAKDPADIPVNFSALMLKREEAHQRDVGLRLRTELESQFEKQERIEQALSILFPIVAIQISSSALAATDFASERYQLAEADRFWASVVNRVYLDVASSSGPNADRVLRGRDYWSQFPFFSPVIPSPNYALNACLLPGLGLLLLTASGLFIAMRKSTPAIPAAEGESL